MPIEPSRTLIFWSSTMCGILAAFSKAWMAQTSTASLVRTSSRNRCLPMLLSALWSPAWRALLQVGNKLGFPPAARDCVEDETGNDGKKGQQHETGGENCRRDPGDDSALDIGQKNRDRERNRSGRKHNAHAGKENQRSFRSVETHYGERNAQAVAPRVQLRSRALWPGIIGGLDLGHRQLELEGLNGT